MGAAHKALHVSSLTFELLDLDQRTVDALLQFVHVVQHALVQVRALGGVVLHAVQLAALGLLPSLDRGHFVVVTENDK